MEDVLNLQDVEDLHAGLWQALVEQAVDLLVDWREGGHVHHDAVLLGVWSPRGRVPGGELFQGIHAEVTRRGISRSGDSQNACPVQ